MEHFNIGFPVVQQCMVLPRPQYWVRFPGKTTFIFWIKTSAKFISANQNPKLRFTFFVTHFASILPFAENECQNNVTPWEFPGFALSYGSIPTNDSPSFFELYSKSVLFFIFLLANIKETSNFTHSGRNSWLIIEHKD